MSTHHPNIDVREQQALGFGRTFALCLKGIRHRLLRSMLTFAVIVLAVAFFMFLLSGSIQARAVHHGVLTETQAVRRAPQALEAWFGRPSVVVLERRLAIAKPSEIRQIASFTGADPAVVAGLATSCADAARFLRFLDELDAGTRSALVKKVRSADVFTWLAEPGRLATFQQVLGQFRSLRSPLAATELANLVAQRPATLSGIKSLVERWGLAVERLAVDLSRVAGASTPAAMQDWFVAADSAGLAAWSAVLQQRGVVVEDVAGIQADLRALRLREKVASELATDAVRKRWKQVFHDAPTPEEQMLRLDDERVLQVLSPGYLAADLAAISATVAHEMRLVDLDRALAGKVPADDEIISGRQLFLVTISFVVCMVGIANAMLMAITERFREIATMKCLGATDGFILTQFLMEAGMQGVAGGVLGMVLGMILALLLDGAVYGSHLFLYFPALGLLACAGICIVVGFLLATLASIYPSWMASRMAPMDAMRVE